MNKKTFDSFLQSMFNWADEFLGEDIESTVATTTVALDTGNLATTPNPTNLLLTSQNFAVNSSVQNVSAASSPFQNSVMGQAKAGMVMVGGQQVINTAQTG